MCAIERGARCHAPTKATTIEAGRDHVAVATGDGPVISAAYVILATGYELMELVPTKAHAVMGYGGNGITFSRIAAEIVRADLTGATDADAALFAFEV